MASLSHVSKEDDFLWMQLTSLMGAHSVLLEAALPLCPGHLALLPPLLSERFFLFFSFSEDRIPRSIDQALIPQLQIGPGCIP